MAAQPTETFYVPKVDYYFNGEPVLLYQQGFRYFNMGYASAMAMLLLGVAFAVTLFIIVNSRRFVHYHGAVR